MLLSAYSLNQLGYFGVNSNGANPRSTLSADASGNFYGTTSSGGAYGYGTVFELAKGSNTITTLASFNNADGADPYAGVTLDAADNLYGTTYGGGTYGLGTVFEIAQGSAAITTLCSFNGTNGAAPFAGLTIDASGNLYGTTQQGGANNLGTVFEFASGSVAITTLASFNGTNGSLPESGLTLDASGNLYGATYQGGSNNDGTVFEIAGGSAAITTLASFAGANGANPEGAVILDPSGNLYGTTYAGGTVNYGSMFEIAAGSATISCLASFNGTNGEAPESGITADSAGNLYGTTSSSGANYDGTAFELAVGSTAITTLASFNGTNGRIPYAGLTVDTSGNLYGAGYQGGANGQGSLFEIGKGATSITVIASFDPKSGVDPYIASMLDESGNVFGTTNRGGAYDDGTAFEIAKASDVVTTIATFNGTNGLDPEGGIAFDDAGNLYGATYEGTSGRNPNGTVYEIPSGGSSVVTLDSFTSAEGIFPRAGVTLDAAGDLYGTTSIAGSSAYGTVYEFPKGATMITTLASFNSTNGATPHAGITLDASGDLYGTTVGGGANSDGTVFEIAKGSKTITTLFSFNGANGSSPSADVTFDADGNLYGTTSLGGTNGYGTVFEIPNGSTALTTLASFNVVNGQFPEGKVVLDASGNLYGTTLTGGANGQGTVFEIAKGSNSVTTLFSFTSALGRPFGALVLGPSGELYGTTTNGAGAVFELSPNPTPTVTLTLAGGSNPSNASQSLTFTATVSGGVPNGDTVTLVDTTNNDAVVATGTLTGGSATLTIPAGTLAVATHNLVAVYAGDANFAASESAPYAQVVQASPPALVGAPVINGDNPNGLYNALGQTTPGTQRSMVEDIVYTFSEPVTINDANQAFTLAVAGPAGGTLPATLYAQAVANSNGTRWAVSLTGMPEGTIGSIANGEYSITINPACVFAAADGVTSMAPGTGRTDTFYRLYGDVFGTRNVNNADYNLFKKSINAYNPAFDDFGTGATSSNADYNVFKKDLNIDYSSDGFVTTI